MTALLSDRLVGGRSVNIMISVLLGLSSATVAAEKGAGFKNIDDTDIADVKRAGEWLAYGKTHNEQGFSPLDQINAGNVSDLKVDWFLDLPNDVGLVSTPLMVNGMIYFVGSRNVVRAVNAVTGNLIWEHDAQPMEHSGKQRRIGWMHSRGITLWNDKVYQATWDGRLIALDAATGKPVWTQQTLEPGSHLYITGAPKAFKGKILIGNGGTEDGASRGYVTAYDADSGADGDFDDEEVEARRALAWSYAQLGAPDRAEQLLRTLEDVEEKLREQGLANSSETLFDAAQTALQLGETDLALDRFEAAVRAGWRQYYRYYHHPVWATLADNPRYRALMAEVKADVDRQRAEVMRIDAEEDFPALLDKVRASRP